jgi:hypothetical protein
LDIVGLVLAKGNAEGKHSCTVHPYLKILYDAEMLWVYDMEVVPKRGKVDGDVSPLSADFRNDRWTRGRMTTNGRVRIEMVLRLRDREEKGFLEQFSRRIMRSVRSYSSCHNTRRVSINIQEIRRSLTAENQTIDMMHKQRKTDNTTR